MTAAENPPPTPSGQPSTVAMAKEYLTKVMQAETPTPADSPLDRVRALDAKATSRAKRAAPAQPSLTEEQTNAYMEARFTWKSKERNHSFNRDLANDHGIPAAILLKYLAYRVAKSHKVHEERQWHYESIADLARRYPYLSATSIHETLRRLAGKGVLLRRRFNRRRNDKTTWYAFTDLATARRAFERVIYFNPEYAAQFGLHEAILLHNLRYWVNRNRDKDYRYRFHAMSPVELARILPLSRSSIARALQHLVKAGVLEKNQSRTPQAPEYALALAFDPCPIPGITDQVSGDGAKIKTGIDRVNSGDHSSIPNDLDANPNGSALNPDVLGANPELKAQNRT